MTNLKIIKNKGVHCLMKNKTSLLPYIIFLTFCSAMVSYTLYAAIFTPPYQIEVPKINLNKTTPPNNEIYYQKLHLLNYIKLNSTVPFDDALSMAVTMVDFAEKYNLDSKLVCAIAHTESGFNYKQINSKNCFGLLQIRPSDNLGKDVWGQELKRENIISSHNDLLDLTKNINAGCYILSKYKNLYGSWYDTLSHYSGKENNLEYNAVVMNYYDKLGGKL